MRFLRDEHDIEWAGSALICKSDDGNTIRIFDNEKSAEIIINDNKGKAALKISDTEKTHDLKVKKEDGKLNIYLEGMGTDFVITYISALGMKEIDSRLTEMKRNDEIIRLETQLNDIRNNIVKIQTEVPKIYYAGAIFGIAGTVFGIFSTNLIYFVVGLGTAITAIVGILEVKINARQGVV